MVRARHGAILQLLKLLLALVLVRFGLGCLGQGFQAAIAQALVQQGALEFAAGDQRVFNIQQILCFEHAAAPGQCHLFAHIMRAADTDILGGDQPSGFGRFLLAQHGDIIGSGRFKGTRQRRRGRKIAVGGQAFEDFGVFENVQGLTIHGIIYFRCYILSLIILRQIESFQPKVASVARNRSQRRISHQSWEKPELHHRHAGKAKNARVRFHRPSKGPW